MDNIDETFSDEVAAYRRVCGGDSLEKIAISNFRNFRNLSDYCRKNDEYSQKAKVVFDKVTSFVNREMIHRQREYSDTCDILFLLAEINNKISQGNSTGISDKIYSFATSVREKNLKNRKNGLNDIIDSDVMDEVWHLIDDKSHASCGIING